MILSLKRKMSKNKKVINATKSTYNGIKFRSKTEERVYKKLLSLGYNPNYELEPTILWEGFRPTKTWYLEGEPQITKKTLINKAFEDWNYTPDFLVEMNGYRFYIEAKGHPNDLWPYKRKLFLKWLETQDKAYFFQIKTIKALVESLEIMKKISSQ